MSEQVGPNDVCCDAPLYRIVQACRGLGIRSPEDVRWLRMSTFRFRRAQRTRGVTAYLRELFGGRSPNPNATCTCGGPLPGLEGTLVAFAGGRETVYSLGQCARCRTVFWDASQPG
jgi:hypothetical protein